MEKIILVLHVLTALAIIALILLQQGKGADMGASFGSGASQTVFGSSGSGNFFTRATAVMATLFFATSFGLTILAKQNVVTVSDLPAAVEKQVEAPLVDAPVTDGTAPKSDVPEVPAQ